MRLPVVVFIAQSVRSSSAHFGGSFTYFTVIKCRFRRFCVPTFIPSVWLVMTQRVVTFCISFSRRREATATVGTSLSPHCLRVCLEIHEIFSCRLHRPIRAVIVGPFSQSFTYFTVINCRFSSFVVYLLFHFYLPKNLPREDETNTIVSLIFSRVRRNSWECVNLFPSLVDAVCHTPSSMWFFIDRRRQNFLVGVSI